MIHWGKMGPQWGGSNFYKEIFRVNLFKKSFSKDLFGQESLKLKTQNCENNYPWVGGWGGGRILSWEYIK